MRTVTVTTREQVLAVVNQSMGFQPTDSLVVLGTGGAPTARVDVGPMAELRAALSPALVHWRPVKVLALGYGAGQHVVDDLARWLLDEGIEVATVVKADNDEGIGLRSDSELDARHVAHSRAGLEAEAAKCNDVAIAAETALISYEEGRGPQAWVYLDRWQVLAGRRTPEMVELARKLEQAVDPRGDRS